MEEFGVMWNSVATKSPDNMRKLWVSALEEVVVSQTSALLLI